MATFTNAVINAEKAVIYLHQTELPVSNDDDGEEVCGRSDEDDGQLAAIWVDIFYSSQTVTQNKLECLYLTSFSGLV